MDYEKKDCYNRMSVVCDSHAGVARLNSVSTTDTANLERRQTNWQH
jgi:hypothetical protein